MEKVDYILIPYTQIILILHWGEVSQIHCSADRHCVQGKRQGQAKPGQSSTLDTLVYCDSQGRYGIIHHLATVVYFIHKVKWSHRKKDNALSWIVTTLSFSLALLLISNHFELGIAKIVYYFTFNILYSAREIYWTSSAFSQRKQNWYSVIYIVRVGLESVVLLEMLL